MGIEATRTTVALPWGPVSYLEWAPPAGADASVVVLLHGGGLDSAWLSWGELGGELAAAGHRVLAPDHPGYGHSPRAPWRATQDRLLGYVAAFASALGLERYALAGLSLGGGLAIGHALEHPDRVRALVLLGSYGLQPTLVEGALRVPAQLASWAALRTGVLQAATRASARDRRVLERSLRPVLRDPARRSPELLDAVAEEARRGSGLEVFAEWQRAEVGLRRQSTDYSAMLARIEAPTLFVHGERDAGVPAPVAERAAASMPRARAVVVPGAGHWVQRDRPDVVVPAMIDHLASLD
ncbi:hypothetical protein L332_09515 [Agrococcus pavilionensis RW1]|uniref:AB hydrolase-1 domain-containing protein n=1 Tax=Agrococcus pavilionensis RW1 TaxID=1330458 RepID=U1LC09_9MICO|nr:alpha/beta hydrolase [Agrococcus pavilionensis]ERG64683.1 hypothetical protein L332_09515 [Agrococcus pavilionensis RW1]